MENDVFKTNPVFQNLSPEKLSFLMNFANSKKPTEMKDMMPFLLGTLSSAKKQNIQFTKPETELMISILKQSMSTPSVKVEMPPCSEEIAIVDNNLYVLFESASSKYFEGTDGKGTSVAPIDKVLKVNVATIW